MRYEIEDKSYNKILDVANRYLQITGEYRVDGTKRNVNDALIGFMGEYFFHKLNKIKWKDPIGVGNYNQSVDVTLGLNDYNIKTTIYDNIFIPLDKSRHCANYIGIKIYSQTKDIKPGMEIEYIGKISHEKALDVGIKSYYGWLISLKDLNK